MSMYPVPHGASVLYRVPKYEEPSAAIFMSMEYVGQTQRLRVHTYSDTTSVAARACITILYGIFTVAALAALAARSIAVPSTAYVWHTDIDAAAFYRLAPALCLWPKACPMALSQGSSSTMRRLCVRSLSVRSSSVRSSLRPVPSKAGLNEPGLSSSLVVPPPRRHASTDNQSSPHDKHHHDDAHPAPVEEHFGVSFVLRSWTVVRSRRVLCMLNGVKFGRVFCGQKDPSRALALGALLLRSMRRASPT